MFSPSHCINFIGIHVFFMNVLILLIVWWVENRIEMGWGHKVTLISSLVSGWGHQIQMCILLHSF